MLIWSQNLSVVVTKYISIYCLEEYLVKLSKANRILLTELRACNIQLPITVGEHNNIRREDRVCEQCNARALGDEYHVYIVVKILKYAMITIIFSLVSSVLSLSLSPFSIMLRSV